MRSRVRHGGLHRDSMRVRVLLGCMLLGCASAAEVPTSGSRAPDASVSGPPAVEPERPEPVLDAPSADALARLRRSLSRSARQLHVERRSGRVHVNMAGTFQSATIVTYDAHGKLGTSCVDNPEDLESMLRVPR